MLPSTAAEVRLNPQIKDDDVTLDARSWAVVAALSTEGTANSVAKQLRIFEFAAAKKIAELIRRGLVTVVEAWDDLPQEGLKLESEEIEPVEQDEPQPEEAEEVTEEPQASDSEPDEEPTEDDEDREPPAGELARRWRELSSARQRGDG